MHRSLIAASILLLATATAPAQIIEGVGPAKKLEMENRYRNYQQVAESMPLLKVDRLNELLALRVEEGRMVLDTPAFKPADGPATNSYQIKLPEFPGPTTVRTYSSAVLRAAQPGAAPQAIRTRSFIFTSYELPDKETLVTYTLQSSATSLRLQESRQQDGSQTTVSIQQQWNEGGNVGGGLQYVSLQVYSYGQRAEGRNNVSIRAANLEALLIENPKLVDTHIRPLLARFGQEHIFAPDPFKAWQVLNEYWPTDPAISQRVQAVLPQFDNADFRAREAALKELIDLGRPGAAAMLRLDRTRLSPEQSVMVDRALSSYQRLAGDTAAKLKRDVSFLLDTLLSEDAEVRRAALAQLKSVTDRKEIDFDGDATLAARSQAVRALRRDLLGVGIGPATQPATQPSVAQPAPTPPLAPEAR